VRDLDCSLDNLSSNTFDTSVSDLEVALGH
jgi:hypothetical protein